MRTSIPKILIKELVCSAKSELPFVFLKEHFDVIQHRPNGAFSSEEL